MKTPIETHRQPLLFPGRLARSLPSQRHNASLFQPFYPPARRRNMQKGCASPSVPWTTLQCCPLSLENTEPLAKGQERDLGRREVGKLGYALTSPARICLRSRMSENLPRGAQGTCNLAAEMIKFTVNIWRSFRAKMNAERPSAGQGL